MYIAIANYDMRESIGGYSTDVICVSEDLDKCAAAIENDNRLYAIDLFFEPRPKVIFEKDTWYYVNCSSPVECLDQSYTVYDITHDSKIKLGYINYLVYEREVV